jgi:spermidine/putrescine-binding protein
LLKASIVEQSNNLGGCTVKTRKGRFQAAGVLASATALLVLSACGGGGDDSGSSTGPPSGDLSFFAFQDAFAPPLIKPFEEEFPEVSLQTAAFGSGDEAITKLKAGFQADVVNVCVEDTQRMVDEGLLQPIDTSEIPNWKDLSPEFTSLEGVEVDGDVYLAPMVGGTTGLNYSPENVPDGIHSYADLFDDRFAGRVAIEGAPENAIPAAAFALGIADPIHMTDEDLDRVEEFLISKKPNIRTFFYSDSDLLNLYKNNEIDVSTGYQGTANQAAKDDLPLEYSYPDEGTITWTCGYGISADAKNVNAANALINYYAGVDPQAFQARQFSYVVSNSKVVDAVSAEVAEQAGLTTVDDIPNPVPYALPDNYEQWQEVMDRVKAS